MCRTRSPVWLLSLLLMSGSALAADPPAPSFEKDVRPILDAKCVKCHNSGKTRKYADLDLSTPAGILKGGESGPAVVAGKPEKSLLYEKVHKGEMPPGKKDAVTQAEGETLRRWIADGAKVPAGSEAELTQHDVIPIMLRHCTACHGRYKQEANLDLRTPAAMLRGGKSGPAIVRGNPAESFVVKRISAGEMPPPKKLIEACVKPVEKSELDTLMKWIAAGAPVVDVQPDVATTTPDPLVTDKDRDFWAFRPAARPEVPKTKTQISNPIDAFVLAKLEAKGLTFAPQADRATLMRRAYYDLTGLPPEPSEVKAFLEDKSPDAYEKLIDKLLTSPRYGERWGRYWLDLAGYADSEGKREQDLPRPHAWRYRDYVTRAFNTDKPYDQFLREQLAGDELADYTSAKTITPELYDNLAATGFLRMTPDATWANITGFIPDRIEVIADEIDVLGSAVLGLTMKCARCHSHKFDPIPQRDYYRLVAVFKGALDEYDWLKPDVRPGLGPESVDVLPGRLLPFVTTAERRAWESNDAKLRKEIDALKAALDQKAAILTAGNVEERLAKLPVELRDDLRAMLATAPEKRDAVQRYLAEKFEKQLRIDRNALKALDPAFKKESDETDARVRTIQTQRLPRPQIQALWDRGDPSPTYVYRRGDSLNPGQLVG